MKKNHNAFTLVELIVVITILAILGTIAFISLQGYSQDSKNAKISQDLSSLKHLIEINLSNHTITTPNALIVGDTSAVNAVSASATVALFDEKNTASTGTLDNVSVWYSVGNINFPALRQNGDDFKDSDDNDYLLALAYSGGNLYYQLAGQQKENSWDFIAIIKGNYVSQVWNTPGLISPRGSLLGITHTQNLWWEEENRNLY